MLKPCSRVLRKLSGELTTIQYCAVRPPPDLRLRRERPDLAGRWSSAGLVSCASDTVGMVSGVSDTDQRLLAVRGRRMHRAELLRLRQERAQVADLPDVAHLVPGNHPAQLEQGHPASARVVDRALPLRLAPAVEQVDGPPTDASQVLQRFLQGPGQVLVVARVDGRPYVGRRLTVEMRVTEKPVDSGRGVDKVRDQAAKGRKGGAVAVAEAVLVEPGGEVARPLGHRSEKQHDVGGGHLLLEFHCGWFQLKPLTPTLPPMGVGRIAYSMAVESVQIACDNCGKELVPGAAYC